MTMAEKIAQARDDFFHDGFYKSAYSAAVVRARVYKQPPETATKAEKKIYAKIFASKLASFKKKANPAFMEIAASYDVVVSEDDHIDNILNLCDKFGELSRKHGGIFKNDHFKIGSAQKLLNLYLKYLWVADDKRPPPPHCPFDRIVIHDIMAKCFGRKGNREVRDKLLAVKWTELDWIEDKDGELGYSSLVKYAKQCNDDDDKYPSLAEWELVEYNNQ